MHETEIYDEQGNGRLQILEESKFQMQCAANIQL